MLCSAKWICTKCLKTKRQNDKYISHDKLTSSYNSLQASSESGPHVLANFTLMVTVAGIQKEERS
jgi:hypothetical protein